MKTNSLMPLAALLLAVAACNNKSKTDAMADSDSLAASSTVVKTGKTKIVPGSYVSLETGKPVYIVEDTVSGYAMDTLTHLPVTYYIDTSGDTLNNMGEPVSLMRSSAGTWIPISDSAKVKMDGDKIKIKDGDTKIKIDGDDSKIKSGDYKKKVDADKGKAKEKDGDTKVKVDNEKVKVKPDNR